MSFHRILSLIILCMFLSEQVYSAHSKPLNPTQCSSFVNKNYSAPLIVQNKLYNCGPACALSWLNSIGDQTQTLATLEKILGTTKEFGTSYKDFINGLNQLGYAAIFKDEQTLENLQKILGRGLGVVVSMQLEGEGHWALLVDISEDGEKIMLMDPWFSKKGYRVVPREEFLRNWYDFFGGEKELKTNGIIVIRPPHERE